MSQFLAMFSKGSTANPSEGETKKPEQPQKPAQSGFMFSGLEIKASKKSEAKLGGPRKDESVLPTPSSVVHSVSARTEESAPSYVPPKFFVKEPEVSPRPDDVNSETFAKARTFEESRSKPSPKTTLTSKGANDALIAQMAALQHQRKEKDIEGAFARNLQSEPLRASKLLADELEVYYKQYISLQLEEQSLLVKKNELQKDIESRYKEIEEKTRELEELTNNEEYKEAELLDLKLKSVKDLVSSAGT